MKKGFTLIELLVVIAIIGILASIVIVNVSGARKQARDSKRESELKSLQTALEQYANVNSGRYPDSLDSLVPTYVASVPVDPINDSTYHYDYGNTTCSGADSGFRYFLAAKLETSGSGVKLKACASSDFGAATVFVVEN